MKSSKSVGGNSVFFSNTKKYSGKNWFYQKKIVGEVFSVQFFCREQNIKILSACSIITSKLGAFPFYLKGIMTKRLNYSEEKEIYIIISTISKLFSLNGFNNIDLIYDEKDKKIKVLELNNRPGLSTKMNEKLLLKFFKSKISFNYEFVNPAFFFSSTIIYSRANLMITKEHTNFLKNLPKNKFSELPLMNDIVKKNQPICLLHLKSKDKRKLESKINAWTRNVIQNLNNI